MAVQNPPPAPETSVTVFLCGDVMTGRGIDQVLLHPCDPTLHEPYVQDAREYVRLAEALNGPVNWPVDDSYIWGVALSELARVAPDVKLINLETSITANDDYDHCKDIHYRMHPANIGCLNKLGVHCCGLANNHVLDWGQAGLIETLDTLHSVGIVTTGAGRDLTEATCPAVFELPGNHRLLVFACGSKSAGIPAFWAATSTNAGVWLVDENAPGSAGEVASAIRTFKQPGDIVILSLHWGGNWGYEIPHGQQTFAHDLIDCGAVDLVHGHSSHHFKGIEVYREHLILYGCGDWLTDYEGITTDHQCFRDDLGLMYFITLDLRSGELLTLDLYPTQLKQFRLARPLDDDLQWMAGTLNREGYRLGTFVERTPGRHLALKWRRSANATVQHTR